MKIKDSFVVAAPPQRVWAFITDPARMMPCVPGCESIETIDPLHYRAVIRMSLGPIKTRFGYHVLYVATRRQQSLDEARPIIQKELGQARATRAQQDFLQTLENKHTVKVYEETLP